MTDVSDFSIAGALGEPIFGNTHTPDGEPLGVVVIAHGFKGYKDYGMFPRIAESFADAGFIAHRFNFSHSGMTNNIEAFERPDLFEQDTWNKQVFDLCTVMECVSGGDLSGAELPMVLFGHSRGGVTVLLTAGRYANDEDCPQAVGVITAAAPRTCNTLTPDQEELLMQAGSLPSPSSRTGQELRVGKTLLLEQREDPQGHDVLAQVARITCPLLVIHGEEDPTVAAASAMEIVQAATVDARAVLVADADHVFNTPNPMSSDMAPSEQLQTLLDESLAFARERCEAG